MKHLDTIPNSKFGRSLRVGQARRLLGLSQLFSRDLPDEPDIGPIPDLLHLEPQVATNNDAIHDLLELAFLGKEAAKGLDHKVGSFTDNEASGWSGELFAKDLFLHELIQQHFTIRIDGIRFPVNRSLLFQVLSNPPTRLEAIRFRQDILRELETDATLLDKTCQLYQQLAQLLSMFKSPDHATRLDINAFRLDLLRQARQVIDLMADGFATANSGLIRLHQAGRDFQQSSAYSVLADLLDYENHLSSLTVRLNVGGDGEVKDLDIQEIRENSRNRFYRSPLRRLLMRLKIFILYGYKLSRKEIVNRLLHEVFLRISPALTPLVQLLGQLELYLATLSFREQAEARGLRLTMPEMGAPALQLESVFNPLLLNQDVAPVPCDIARRKERTVTIITGPNSGGKTRLLQTLGLTQLLGQSGLYVPAASARLPIVHGLFVSLVETESADQAEGRLGRELTRIRSLFEYIGSPSMVILDELCSGTNPSEGTEIFSMVLQLLDQLDAVTFISTHFLDYAKGLRDQPPVPSLEFLQVESDQDLQSTYQFVSGVAETSLATATARRFRSELRGALKADRAPPPS